MTRIGRQNLYSGKLTGYIQAPRQLEYLMVYNYNPVPLYVRLGSPEIPNEMNFDVLIPPNYINAISINGNQFGFRLGPTNVIPALLTGTTTIEGMVDEKPPVLGGIPISVGRTTQNAAKISGGGGAVVPFNTWTASGLALKGGDFVTGFQMECYINGTAAAAGPFLMAMGEGSNSGILRTWAIHYFAMTGGSAINTGIHLEPTSIGGPGFQLLAATTQIYFYQFLITGNATMGGFAVTYPQAY